MKRSIEIIGRVLCAFMLCTVLPLASCEDTLGNGDDTEQGADQNEENTGGEGESNDAIINVSGGVTLTVSLRNLTETGVAFYGEAKFAENYTANSFGILYSDQETFTAATTQTIPIVDIYGTNYSVSTSSLAPGSTYYYTSYIKLGDLYKYGEIKSFTTASLVAPTLDEASEVTCFDATISGKVTLPSETATGLEYGFQYSTSEDFDSNVVTKEVFDLDSENKFSVEITSLTDNTTYYYRSYIEVNGVSVYGEPKSFKTLQLSSPSGYTDLASTSPANCYIISQCGSYCFPVVRGNASSDWLIQTKESEILWETLGTDVTPNVGDLIKSVSYSDGYIGFQTADTFREGNAVIAAKDADGNILWSWHIWLTDQPQAQVYKNNAGTMMDRNLGATSATPGHVGALGLLYQWGRKDPFLGSSSISSSSLAKSTITWPSAVSSNSSNGTIAYATAHPTTFITYNSRNYDWYYIDSSFTDNTRWTTSSSAKSIYDPCPAGWRVPDGDSSGVWEKAGFDGTTYNSTNEGRSFSISSPSTTWYPASGYRDDSDGGLNFVGSYGRYWSASPLSYSGRAYYLFFVSGSVSVYPSYGSERAYGQSVRCLQE